MATFTTRPVKAGLPTLFEVKEASLDELQRFQVIALVAIADELATMVERLERLEGLKEVA